MFLCTHSEGTPHTETSYFYDLQDVLDRVSEADILILLGDFNARVGKRDPTEDLWQGTLWTHGLDECNQEELLEFSTSNNFTVMNTLFEKKPALLGTWMHPATKRCHMIDYAVMCANQQMLGTDVQVMRGANCWNDHRLVRAKVYMKLFHTSYRKVQQAASFAVHSLLCCSQPRLLLTASFAAHSLLCCSQPPLLLTASFAAHSLVYCSQPPLLLTASFAAHSLLCCSQPRLLLTASAYQRKGTATARL